MRMRVMKLTAYVLDGHSIEIRPAPAERAWMDATDQRFAYRCLPLNIANQHGWELLCPSAFSAEWDGRAALDGLAVRPDAGTTAPALSHFGGGVLTFHVPCLFRTEPGVDLMVMGPINRPKDGIAALSALVETDWAPYSFTMNWLFTRPSLPVRFEAGEPFCHVFPVRRGALEAVEPELRRLSEAPELRRRHEAWAQSRSGFNEDLRKPGSQAQAERWQKLYFRGLDPEGRPAEAEGHRVKLRLRPFGMAPDAPAPRGDERGGC